MSWQNAVFNVNEAQNISEQRFPTFTVHPSPHPRYRNIKVMLRYWRWCGRRCGSSLRWSSCHMVDYSKAWLYLTKKNGKPQEIDSTVYNQRHTRSYSDLSKSNIGDSNFGNSGYMSTVGIMQQPITPGFSPSPFVSASNMVSVSSIGAYSPPPTQPGFRVDSPPSAYHGGTSPPVSRYNSPSPSMQFMNGSQSPDSNRLNASFGNDVSVQPFLLPPPSPSPAQQRIECQQTTLR
ncbi:hypothetical protein BDP27DRAFT_280874 [Rhodocollybia butyracea]|uniref:Uncharacterized protein n=1 Tax=Rhodocollybia butyracea TaxID=206335 RepID=A0A9P5Q2L5_9AGAR|nr:hypothetical protein BDP27DRAFT_280874 [Rhodocollybia butyracea]